MNIGIEISYMGKDFLGSQIQPNFRTVHGELERVLSHVLRQNIKVNFSGRTDSGVHARCGFCNFHVSTLFCEPEKIAFIANRKMPADLRILKSFEVPEDFHARYSAKLKTYRYFFYNGNYDTAVCHTHHHTHSPLEFEKMQRACGDLVGEQDFFPFMATGSNKKMTVRHVTACTLTKEPCEYTGDEEGFHFVERNEIGRSRGFLYTLEITANGFLYNMVRIIAGTLVDIGREHLAEDAFFMALKTKDRKYLGKTLGAEGLHLWKVDYPSECFEIKRETTNESTSE